MRIQEYYKMAAFILIMALLVVFSTEIQNYLVESYNNSVENLASRTLANCNLKGF